MEGRVRILNDQPIRRDGSYVLYWMQMNRRVDANHSLQYAIELADELRLPVLCYEGLTCTYEYANDRIHTFMLEAVPETARRLAKRGIGYCFYPRRTRQEPNNRVYELAKYAAVVVSDDYPTFIARQHNASVPAKLDVTYRVVDSSCIVPMSQMTKREYAAYTIRPKIHKMLPKFLCAAPDKNPRRKHDGPVPEWHVAVTPDSIAALVASCEIDHSVRPSVSYTGGRVMAEKHLLLFVESKLRRYAKERNEPSKHATSDLSPYLHFGNVSSLEVALTVRGYAAEHKLIADEFLEELIVRRELAFNYSRYVEDPHSFDAVPDWARKTMAKHAGDLRDPVYTNEQMERAETYDALWNATQRELLLRGKIHGYYRMYWGKKIMEWSAGYQQALDLMIYLHDRYALDGRDPNTYTNILWCFGLHDRPWIERPIFGMLRYMSGDGMKRKTDTKAYLQEIALLERTGKDPYRVE